MEVTVLRLEHQALSAQGGERAGRLLGGGGRWRRRKQQQGREGGRRSPGASHRCCPARASSLKSLGRQLCSGSSSLELARG